MNPEERKVERHNQPVRGFESPKNVGDVSLGRDLSEIRGLLDSAARQKIRRVLLASDYGGLSWPVIFCGLLTETIPENFPNAEFLDFTGLSRLIKYPKGFKVRPVDRGEFDAYTPQDGRDNTLMFYINRGPPMHRFKSIQAADLTLDLHAFGQGPQEIMLTRPGPLLLNQLGLPVLI